MKKGALGRWAAGIVLAVGVCALAISGCSGGGGGGDGPAVETDYLSLKEVVSLLEQEEVATAASETVGALSVAAAVLPGQLDPKMVRDAARAVGMGSLAAVPVPVPANLDQFLNKGSVAKKAAILLGKALFWDMQVGSDG